jgi:hypothetical protein
MDTREQRILHCGRGEKGEEEGGGMDGKLDGGTRAAKQALQAGRMNE